MSGSKVAEAVRTILSALVDPATGRRLLEGDDLISVSVSPQGVARIEISARAGGEAMIQTAAGRVAGVSRVVVVPRRETLHEDPLGLKKKARIAGAAETLPGVRNVIAIASAKGGVGKSTVAANLAVALARRGLGVGLLDADVFGPSLPTLFGLKEEPATRDGKIVPVSAFGIRAMSIGLLVDPAKAVAWRGPMVMGAVRQLMGDVDWGSLDVLLIDTPPGTGDVHLSLAQSKRLTGAIIVSTPQEMALADVRRGVALYRQTGVAILGLIENMAFLETGEGRLYLFGRGGAEKAAHDLGVPFLGALPIHPELREASDAGAPIVASAPASASARDFADLAEKIAAALIP